jgi:hypothetical protein
MQMKSPGQSLTAMLLCFVLVLTTSGCGGRQVAPTAPLRPSVFDPLKQDVRKSYLELFKISPTLEYSPDQISAMNDYLKESKEYCVGEYKKKRDQYDEQIKQAQDNLKNNSPRLTDSQRHDAHCRIQNLRALRSQTSVLADHAIPVAYQNREAKLELIGNWPTQLKEIRQEIADGSYLHRKWGDVKDIGFREIAPGQKDDIKTGEDAIRQMKMSGLMPKEIENKSITDYVTGVAERIAKHSDLQVPLHVTVLNSKEINAFALPGGFLFIERGLL